MRKWMTIALLPLLAVACNQSASTIENDGKREGAITPVDGPPYNLDVVADLDEPWAMVFLPDGRLLVTEKMGQMKLLTINGENATEMLVSGTPDVDYGNQGGMGDVILAPDFAESGMIYLSWVEAGEDDMRGAVVARAKLIEDADKPPRLEGVDIIWKQNPKVTGRGHFSHRLAFSPDGQYLFIGSGERQKFDPAQDKNSNLGKIVRLNPDGSIPKDNPYYDQGGVAAQIWSLGHRNILGIAFDDKGQLWNQEMGPKHGDEFNLVKKGANYGYPIVSNGDHYDGREIPDHDTRPEFEAPRLFWDPTIAPSGLIFYNGDAFPQWKGNAFVGGLASYALIRIQIDEDGNGKEADRFEMESRIREVEQGPQGNIWLLEDGGDVGEGRLLKLSAK